MSGRKITFHIPERQAHFESIIEAVSYANGITPSEWVYRVVRSKLEDSGVIDKDGELVRSMARELAATLPPQVRKTFKEQING